MLDLVAVAKSPEIDYLGLAPLLAVAGGAIVVLMASLFPGRYVQRSLVPQLAAAALVVAIVFTVANWEPGEVEPIVAGALSIDTLALFMSLLFYVAGLAAIALSLRPAAVQEAGAGEYFALMLGSIAGMTLLAGAENLVTLFIGLELLSIPLYVLCASSVRDRRSLESGLKYLVIGSVGSATLVYGLALLYGATGSTDFGGMARALADGTNGLTDDSLLLGGVALVIVGLAFKASVAPFHQWTPDVYEGAPTPVTAFFAIAPKMAAIALFLRVMIEPFGPLVAEWQQIIVFISIVSMLVGSFAAIWQTNIKRLMAYSSIGHVGYALIGLAAGDEVGVRGVLIYMAIYLFMTAGAFAVILCMRRQGRMVERITDLSGLARTQPMLALALAISMFSMAGIPPLAGFFGKLYIFLAAVSAGLYTLAVIGVLTSVVGAFYYLRLVKLMYFDEPVETFDRPVGPAMAAVLTGSSLFTLLFFVYPAPLVAGASAAAAVLFAG